MSRRKKNIDAARKTKRSPKRERNRWQASLVVFTVFIGLAVRLYQLISRYAVNIFFSDQWDFNDAALFQKHSLWEMFRWQHGPHRQGLGAVLSYLVEPHFQWNSRTESFLVGSLVVLAAICALWLKHRLLGPLTYFDVCIPLILFTPSQFETLFMTANLAHGPVPLVLIILYCIAWTIPNPLPRYSFVLLANFLTIYTGFGIFLGAATPIALVADYYLNRRHLQWGKSYLFASLLVSLASLGSYFVGYTFQTAVDCSPNLFESPLSYAHFLCLMFANLLGAQGPGFFPTVVGATLISGLLLALVINCRGLVLKQNTHRPLNMVAPILILYCLLFSANAAYGRSCLGSGAAQESRYVIYMGLGLLGLYFYLFTIRKTLLRVVLLTSLTASLVGTIPIRSRDEWGMVFYSTVKQKWRQCYLDLGDIGRCDQLVGYWIYPRPERNDLKGKLDYLKRTKQNLYSDIR